MFTLMMTWKQGRSSMSKSLRNDAIDLGSFLESRLRSARRRGCPGPRSSSPQRPGLTPNALLHNLSTTRCCTSGWRCFAMRPRTSRSARGQAPRHPRAGRRPVSGDRALRLHGVAKRDPHPRRPRQTARAPNLPLEETTFYLGRQSLLPTGRAPWRAGASGCSCSSPATRARRPISRVRPESVIEMECKSS